MAGSFSRRTRELADQVGNGDLEMKLVVDQPYAFWVEVRDELQHPRGQSRYVETTMMAGADGWMATLAAGAYHGLRLAAIEVSEEMVADAANRTPVEFADLIRSGAPTVTDDGAVVYARPAAQRRLSEAEVKAKKRGRWGGDSW